MNKKELQKLFEEKYLKGTCFSTLKDLLKDRTDIQTNAYNACRALTAVELRGVWKGLQELLKQKAR